MNDDDEPLTREDAIHQDRGRGLPDDAEAMGAKRDSAYQLGGYTPWQPPRVDEEGPLRLGDHYAHLARQNDQVWADVASRDSEWAERHGLGPAPEVPEMPRMSTADKIGCAVYAAVLLGFVVAMILAVVFW